MEIQGFNVRWTKYAEAILPVGNGETREQVLEATLGFVLREIIRRHEHEKIITVATVIGSSKMGELPEIAFCINTYTNQLVLGTEAEMKSLCDAMAEE